MSYEKARSNAARHTSAQTLSHLPRNQVDHRVQRSDCALNEDRKILSENASTSAYLPDVPLQCYENIGVAVTVRECVRVLGSEKRGN